MNMREIPDRLREAGRSQRREEEEETLVQRVKVPRPLPPRMAHLSLSPSPPMPVLVKANNGQTLGLFFGYQFFFSNFHSCRFELEGNSWTCTEHYYVYEKLLHFGKADVARAIAKVTDYSVREQRERLHVPYTPARMKAVGREAEERASETKRTEWTRAKVDVMKRCVRAKFEQNSHLGNALLDTGDMELVEASPGDKFWGNGLPLQHPQKHADVAKWRLDGGKNMLGNVLMWVRGELKKQRGEEPVHSCVEVMTPSPIQSDRDRTASPNSVEEQPVQEDHRYGSVMQRLSTGAIFPSFQSSKRSFRTSAGPLGPQLPPSSAVGPSKRAFTALEEEWVEEAQLPQATKPSGSMVLKPRQKMPAQVWDSDEEDEEWELGNSGKKKVTSMKPQRSPPRPAYVFHSTRDEEGNDLVEIDSDDDEDEFEEMVARFSAVSYAKRRERRGE